MAGHRPGHPRAERAGLAGFRGCPEQVPAWRIGLNGMAQQQETSAAGAAFKEGHVEADGFRIRYMEAGQHGAPLVHLHGARGLLLTPAHDLLSRQCRVITFEMPGFGQSPENTRTQSMPELAATMGEAIAKLGIGTFNLLGTSFGAR